MKFLNAILCLTIIFIFLLLAPASYAATLKATPASPSPSPSLIPSPAFEQVNPNGGFSYVLKRLEEKIKLTFLSISSNSKEQYLEALTAKRFAELDYVIENKDMANFEKSTIRYSTTAGNMTEFILGKNLTDKKANAAMLLKQELPTIEQLMTKYDGTTAEWRFVKQDADYLRIYISKLEN